MWSSIRILSAIHSQLTMECAPKKYVGNEKVRHECWILCHFKPNFTEGEQSFLTSIITLFVAIATTRKVLLFSSLIFENHFSRNFTIENENLHFLNFYQWNFSTIQEIKRVYQYLFSSCSFSEIFTECYSNVVQKNERYFCKNFTKRKRYFTLSNLNFRHWLFSNSRRRIQFTTFLSERTS